MKSYNTCLGVGSTLHVFHLQWAALSHWEAFFSVTQSLSASCQHQKPDIPRWGILTKFWMQNSGSTACSIIHNISLRVVQQVGKAGGKGNKLPHLMAWKKLYFEHIFTIRWLHLCIQMNWTQYTCDTLFSEYRQRLQFLPISVCLSLSVFSRRGTEKAFESVESSDNLVWGEMKHLFLKVVCCFLGMPKQ